jgi:hypothetical protein
MLLLRAVLLLTGVAASAVPAIRAARVDPLIALRRNDGALYSTEFRWLRASTAAARRGNIRAVPLSTDARNAIEQLLKQLNGKRRKNPPFVLLTTFLSQNASVPDRRSRQRRPGEDHRRVYLDLVVRALSGLYVHMAFKRARHGANPVERLLSLSLNLPHLTDQDVQQELLGIFLELHDPHTFYVMPKPYDTSTAFLPFLVAACYDSQLTADANEDPEPFFVVTRVARGFDCPGSRLAPGSRIGTVYPSPWRSIKWH